MVRLGQARPGKEGQGKGKSPSSFRFINGMARSGLARHGRAGQGEARERGVVLFASTAWLSAALAPAK